MRFLISEFTGLGDFIQKTPMIEAIHQFDESAEVFVIGDNRWGAINLVKNSPLITNVHNVLTSADIAIPKDYNNATINRLCEDHRSEI